MHLKCKVYYSEGSVPKVSVVSPQTGIRLTLIGNEANPWANHYTYEVIKKIKDAKPDHPLKPGEDWEAYLSIEDLRTFKTAFDNRKNK